MDEPRQSLTDLERVMDSVYREHAAGVLHFLLYLSGNYALAQDLTSETFVRVWTLAAGGIRTASVKAYLFTIARNLYLDHARRQQSRRPVDMEDVTIPVGVADLPDARHEQREELAQTLRDLTALPEGDRAALVLAVFEELSYAEVAAALGIKVNAVKARVFRARLQLAEIRGRRAATQGVKP